MSKQIGDMAILELVRAFGQAAVLVAEYDHLEGGARMLGYAALIEKMAQIEQRAGRIDAALERAKTSSQRNAAVLRKILK